MSNTRRSYLISAPIMIMLGSFVTAAFGDAPNQQAVQGSSFIKVGSYYINADRIDYAVVDGDRVAVAFEGASKPSLTLTGSDAQIMQQWLAGRVTHGRRSPPVSLDQPNGRGPFLPDAP